MIILGVFMLAGFVGWYGYNQQAKRYEQIIRILAADRDKIREECTVYRNLLFPVLGRVEGATEASRVEPRATTRPAQAAVAPSAQALLNRRTPFRIRFKQAVTQFNTPQKSHDALVKALESTGENHAQKG